MGAPEQGTGTGEAVRRFRKEVVVWFPVQVRVVSEGFLPGLMEIPGIGGIIKERDRDILI